jgi:signal peptidase II
MARLKDARGWMFLIALMVVALDRVTKRWIVAHIESGHAIVVWPGVFRLTHVLNTGAAFSMFEGARHPEMVRWTLIGFTIVVVMGVVAVLFKSARTMSLFSISLALILGGAIGNLYDRIHLRYVVDFLEVTIVHYHWPDFNVADSAIVVGACLLLIETFRPQEARHP